MLASPRLLEKEVHRKISVADPVFISSEEQLLSNNKYTLANFGSTETTLACEIISCSVPYWCS
jgi:hypothetical protein